MRAVVRSSLTTSRAKWDEKVLVSRWARSMRMSAMSFGSAARSTPGDDIGAVFRIGEPLRFRIRGLVGQRVDARALGLAFAARQSIAMDRDEELGLTQPRESHPFGRARSKVSSGSRHRHAVFADLFQLVAQHGGEFEHQVLFKFAARRMGPGVDSAMAGIDHHHRAWVGGLAAASCGGRRRFGLPRQDDCRSRRPQERLAVDRHEIDHHARRLALDGIEHEGLGDPHRARDVDDDARAALPSQDRSGTP